MGTERCSDLLMLVWHNATTVRIHHFFFVEKAQAVSLRLVASFRMLMLLSPFDSLVGRACRELPELPLPPRVALVSPTGASFPAIFSILVEKSASLRNWLVGRHSA